MDISINFNQFMLQLSSIEGIINTLTKIWKSDDSFSENMQKILFENGYDKVIINQAENLIRQILSENAPEFNKILKENIDDQFISNIESIVKRLDLFFAGDINVDQLIEQLNTDELKDIINKVKQIYLEANKRVDEAQMNLIMKQIAPLILSICILYALVNCVRLTFNAFQLAKHERIIYEQECEKIIQQLIQAREEYDRIINQELSCATNEFSLAMKEIEESKYGENIDLFIQGNVRIQKMLGKKAQFTTEDEFEDMILNGIPLKL